jgi:hypothetical protein
LIITTTTTTNTTPGPSKSQHVLLPAYHRALACFSFSFFFIFPTCVPAASDRHR